MRNKYIKRLISSNSILVFFLLVHFTRENSCPSLYISEKNIQFNPIGIAEIYVKNQIYDPSQLLKFYKREEHCDKSVKYPEYTNIDWVQGDHNPGYFPRKYIIPFYKYTVLKNVFFTTECVIIDERGYHTFRHSCHPRYWGLGQPYHTPHIVCPKYDKVICIGHQHTEIWGHWFLEIFPCYITLPKEDLETSVICVTHKTDFIINNLALLGVKSYQIIDGYNARYYANTFITIETTCCGDLNRALIVRMKQYLEKMFCLNSIKPTRFGLYNRPKNKSRHLINFDQIVETTRKRFPKNNWEVVVDLINFEEQAKYYRTFKFLFAMHTSFLANEIFLKEGSVVIEVQTSLWLLSFINLGPMTGIHQVVGRNETIPIFEYSPSNELKVEYAINLIKRGLSRLKI